MNRRAAVFWIMFVALAGFAALVIIAPEYLIRQGYPLDDAWIHAVYGRALARSGSLAYNPGIPATGSTSPLWSALLALPHLLGSSIGGVVVLTKLLGFGLHALGALVLYAALANEPGSAAMRLAGALFVAFHPDLISASVSGMEIPLATLAAAGLLYAAQRPGLAYASISAVAALARPELALVSGSVAFLLHRRSGRLLLVGSISALLGSALAFGGLALRNIQVSGLPLPATFYAKVGADGSGVSDALRMGFAELLGQLPIADSSILMTGLAAVSGLVLLSKDVTARPIAAASAFVSGLLFCAVSFILIPPIDPKAFYHQRYVLPVLPMLVAPVPILADHAIERWLSARHGRAARAVLLALLSISLLIDTPARYRRLANDAKNIDDVQVAVGRVLTAAPVSDVVWAIDAGAIRYFGNAFVVDLMGLNTPQMLGVATQEFLYAHPPRYVEVVPGWSSLDEESLRRLKGARFKPSTPYTVTSFAPMRDHWLVRCDPDWQSGRVTVKLGSFAIHCAPGRAATAQGRGG